MRTTPAGSDKVILRKQVFVQVFPGTPPTLLVHSGERYLDPKTYPDLASIAQIAEAPSSDGLTVGVQRATACDGLGPGTNQGWDFIVNGTGFTGTFHLEVEEADDPARPADRRR